MDHRKQPERLVDLVPLQAPDKVPGHAGDFRHFGPRLLHPILPEHPQAARHPFADAIQSDRLRDRDQEHALGTPAAAQRRVGDPGANPRDVGPDIRHLPPAPRPRQTAGAPGAEFIRRRGGEVLAPGHA